VPMAVRIPMKRDFPCPPVPKGKFEELGAVSPYLGDSGHCK